MPLEQKTRLLNLKTPLGENELLLTGFTGKEEISRLFSFQLDMISDNPAVNAADIVGKNVSFNVELSDGSRRHFNGFVSRFIAGDEEDGRRNYRAEVVPWLWFLTQTADCRIFQNLKIADILKKIFEDLGFKDFKVDLKGDHKSWDYCVQYRETDFNFVSRLMEEEGIFYFFQHEDGKHTLIIADHKGAYQDCLEKEVDFPLSIGEEHLKDHITSWAHQYEFRPGKWAQTDFNFETPSTSLMAKTGSLVKMPGMDKFEIYDYPGQYAKKAEGDVEVKWRMEEEEAAHDVVRAASGCKTFTPGGKFKIAVHRSASEEGKSFMVTSIFHSAIEPLSYETGGGRVDEAYSNTFTCIPDSVTFRPARITPKPIVNGVQTAIVTGPPGEEIYVDKYGRVKVQFHWDREGKKDDNTSCWLRCAQVHAGRGYGAIDIPRMEDEVIVSFLEGDPDRPIITGRVYHAENMPPYGLPGAKTTSGIKTKTYKGSGYNEMALDDTPGKELIRVHGQYDMDSTIKHDLREHVLNCRSRDVTVDETIQVGGNQSLDVGKNQKYSIGIDQTGTVGANKSLTIGTNHTEKIGSNMSIDVGSNLTENVGINYAETVGVAMELTVGAVMTHTVGAKYNLTVGGPMTVGIGSNLKTTIGASRKEQVGAKVTEKVGGNVSQQYGAKHTEKVTGNYLVKCGAKITLEAASKITLKTGASSIEMSSSGTIKIKGTKILVEGSAKIEEKAATISSEASAKNTVKGAMVNVEASAINTIKGSLVKIN